MPPLKILEKSKLEVIINIPVGLVPSLPAANLTVVPLLLGLLDPLVVVVKQVLDEVPYTQKNKYQGANDLVLLLSGRAAEPLNNIYDRISGGEEKDEGVKENSQQT